MRHATSLVLLILLATPALAQDLGTRAPIKNPGTYPVNIPNPSRQGGDTILDAIVIPAWPYYDTGTTVGYTDDYRPTCLLAGGAPDVVYSYTPAYDLVLAISLCGSSYDTGLYVYDSSLNEIACNDDFCGLQSEIDGVAMSAGNTYYIVIDGYGASSGEYVLSFPCLPCQMNCPPEGLPEGEPPLVDGYVDLYNGGCQAAEVSFQPLTGDAGGELVLCGKGGWYPADGVQNRDTDWYLLSMGPLGTIAVTADAEYETYLFELGPQDCAAVAVLQQVTVGPCSPAFMPISGYTAGAPVWFWVGATAYTPPGGSSEEYDYVLWIAGLEPVVAAQATTWSAVKALYD